MLGALVSTGLSAVTGQPGASMGIPSMGSSASSSLHSPGGVHFYNRPPKPAAAAAGIFTANTGILLAVGVAAIFILGRKR